VTDRYRGLSLQLALDSLDLDVVEPDRAAERAPVRACLSHRAGNRTRVDSQNAVDDGWRRAGGAAESR
jgi:hypothetical protein